jgi:D-arabinose 1-dehydrogenase-like Zn-dependent alcohol dehydrogenase
MRAAVVPAAVDARLELRDVALPEPGTGHVRIKVEACGVCHNDVLTVHNAWPGISYPRIPGREIAGVIDALGAETSGWNVGDRVGVGWHGGHDGTCDRCRRSDFITCRNVEDDGRLTLRGPSLKLLRLGRRSCGWLRSLSH